MKDLHDDMKELSYSWNQLGLEQGQESSGVAVSDGKLGDNVCLEYGTGCLYIAQLVGLSNLESDSVDRKGWFGKLISLYGELHLGEVEDF